MRDASFARFLGEGWTPLIDVSRLGRTLGLTSLMVKQESVDPTGSFKAGSTPPSLPWSGRA